MVKEFEVDTTHHFLYHFPIIYINASPQMATFQLNKATETFPSRIIILHRITKLSGNNKTEWLAVFLHLLMWLVNTEFLKGLSKGSHICVHSSSIQGRGEDTPTCFPAHQWTMEEPILLSFRTEYDRGTSISFPKRNSVFPKSQLNMPTKLCERKILAIPNVDAVALKC